VLKKYIAITSDIDLVTSSTGAFKVCSFQKWKTSVYK
jgi:hypothetical protein